MVVNHLRARPLLVVLATATALAAAPAVAYADGGRPAPVTGGIPLVNTDEKIGPGIDLQHVKALDQKGWYDAQYLTVDLSDRAVGTDLLTSGPVASGGPLSEAAGTAGAVAGVNGEFFDIGNSNAALGGEVQDGKLVKSADIGGRQHVGVSKNGIAQLVDLTVDATAHFPVADHKVLSSTPRTAAGSPRTA
ncbi:hypothetical protein ACWEQ2_41115 [Streptomyces sp. NPDC004096]